MNYKIIYMKRKSENTKRNKGRPGEQNNFSYSPESYKNINETDKYVRKGFVAWPDTKSSGTKKNADKNTLEGRTRNGGYVAYPKQAVTRHYRKHER